jgi:hypothetical protein
MALIFQVNQCGDRLLALLTQFMHDDHETQYFP